MLKCKMVSYRH